MSKMSENNGSLDSRRDYNFTVARSNADIEDKAYTELAAQRREKLQQDVDAFLANGGTIQQIPEGYCNDQN